MAQIYTIGHSNHDIIDFLSLLKNHGIKVVVDVRSEPFSRRMPQFSKSEIERFLVADAYEYLYLGESLGGHPKDKSMYTHGGILDYYRMTTSNVFNEHIQQLIKVAQTKSTAIMCAEGLPTRCHRESIIGCYLRGLGHRVLHILPDGDICENQQLILL